MYMYVPFENILYEKLYRLKEIAISVKIFVSISISIIKSWLRFENFLKNMFDKPLYLGTMVDRARQIPNSPNRIPNRFG